MKVSEAKRSTFNARDAHLGRKREKYKNSDICRGFLGSGQIHPDMNIRDKNEWMFILFRFFIALWILLISLTPRLVCQIEKVPTFFKDSLIHLF